MKILYANNKTERSCTSLKEASKFFGGNKTLALSLLSRINAIEQAEVINDIRLIKPFRFHALYGNYQGFFAVDVRNIRDKWRIILQPLDDNENVFDPCHIDEIAMKVRNIRVVEVSSHYE